MIGERSELLARLLRYHALVRGLADSQARAALRSAIAGIERRLAELDEAPLHSPSRPHRPPPGRRVR
jgi:hypothetical protein